MQHFSVSDLTAKMTRTQKSQKLCKTMLHSLFFFLHHICLYGSPVSHCLLCSVIIIGVAILSTLNYFSLFLKEKLRNKKWNPVTSFTTLLKHWPLNSVPMLSQFSSPPFYTNRKTGKVWLWFIYSFNKYMKSYQIPRTETHSKMNKKFPSSHSLSERNTKEVITE